MSLLDRLKPQPRWKNPDPAVRLSAIAELDDAAELRAVVQEDADPGVRRAAVRRLGDVAFLAAIAHDDADERVREEAAAGLIEIALKGEAADSEAAAAALTDPRQLAQVARQAPQPAVRQAAIARIADGRALGSVARQAADPQTAMQAFEAIADDHEILDVALNSEHKDVALAALERAASRAPEARDTFRTIGARAKHKSVARRANAILQAMEEADAAREAAEAARRVRQAETLTSMESLASATDWRAADAALGDAEHAWRDAGPAPDDLTGRFEAAAAAARQAIARLREAALEQDRRAAALAAARETREALCARVESLTEATADPAAALEAAKAEWSALAPAADLPATDAQLLQARFDRACEAFEERERRGAEIEAARARLAAIAAEAEAAAAGEDPTGLAERWSGLRDAWQQAQADAGPVPEELTARFDQASARIAERDAEASRRQEQAKRDNLSRLTQLCAHLESRAGAEDLKLKEAERGLRNLRAAIDNPLPLPAREDEEQIAERLKALLTALVPRARELRELDDWKRFANAAAQEQLIRQMEALKAEPDLEKAAQTLRDLHVRWRDVAEAPRDHAELLWRRFKTASDEIRTKCGEFFAQRAVERNANLQAKEALCEKAEALAGSTDWIRTAEALKQLQNEWKAVGPVSRKHAKIVWKRFRTACDTFFTRRHDDLVHRKQLWAGNLERKLALCAQAEALADSTEWERAAAEIRRLQAEWKTIGPVRKNKSEVVWQRFRTACDRFFERYKHRHQLDMSARIAEREATVVEIEALLPVDGAEPAPNLAEQLTAAWARWNHLPVMPRELIEPIVTRLWTAIGQLIERYPDQLKGTALDPEGNRRKLEALCQRVENCLSAEPEQATALDLSSATMLAQRLREALAANTIGGRGGSRVSEDAKWRAAADEVKDAQAAWRRIGPVPGEAGRALNDRFNRACQRFFDQHRRRRSAQPTR
jgi:hypothetical protein